MFSCFGSHHQRTFGFHRIKTSASRADLDHLRLYTYTKLKMDESGYRKSKSGSTTQVNTWENKVLIPKMQASIKTNMAAFSPGQQRRKHQALENVKIIAKELAMDVVHHVSNYKSSGPQTHTAKTMRRTVDEMKARHEIMFNSMVQRLELTKESGFQTFTSVADEVFSDSRYNWGRIVSVYAFAGRLAKYYVDHNMPECVDQMGEYLGDYVCSKLAWWIHKQGGWVGTIICVEQI